VSSTPAIARVRLHWTRGYHARRTDRLAAIVGLANPAQRGELNAFLEPRRTARYLEVFFRRPAASGRWTTASLPACYVAMSPIAALHERLHHDALYLRGHHVPRAMHGIEILVVMLAATVDVDDVRPLMDADAALRHPTDYAATQALARSRAAAGSTGLLYRSVRALGADTDCVVLFQPSAIREVRPGRSVLVEWDGERFLVPDVGP
jgi:hypothetical protein